jgi:hydroxymethylbilane synthase
MNSSQPTILRVATRKSPLALRQTEMLCAHLARALPGIALTTLPMSTTGDERLAWSLSAKGGKGLFTSELERALLAGEADIAVHSAKDLPTDEPAGLALAGFLPRESPQDVLVIDERLAVPTTIATGSPRRKLQLQPVFPAVAWCELRGNVQTRLRKSTEGAADATVMALAGLKRMGLTSYPGLRFCPLPVTTSVPAAGQGAIAIQCRVEHVPFLRPLLCAATARAVVVERACLRAMGGGCHSAAAAPSADGRLFLFDEQRGLRIIDWQLPAGADEASIAAAIAPFFI